MPRYKTVDEFGNTYRADTPKEVLIKCLKRHGEGGIAFLPSEASFEAAPDFLSALNELEEDGTIVRSTGKPLEGGPSVPVWRLA